MSDLSYTQYLLKKQQILMAGQPALPTEFEVIVIGTGLEESIVAASVARNGHSVLHIDTKDYYGEAWAAFNLKGIQEWMEDVGKLKSDEVPKEELEKLLKEGEKLHVLERDSSITNVKESWFVDDEDEVIDEKEEPKEEPCGIPENTDTEADEKDKTEGESEIKEMIDLVHVMEPDGSLYGTGQVVGIEKDKMRPQWQGLRFGSQIMQHMKE